MTEQINTEFPDALISFYTHTQLEELLQGLMPATSSFSGKELLSYQSLPARNALYGNKRTESQLSCCDGGIYSSRHRDGRRKAHGHFSYNCSLKISSRTDYYLLDLLGSFLCNKREPPSRTKELNAYAVFLNFR